MAADEPVPVRRIEDRLLHFGVDLLEGIVDAVVVALLIVDGAQHHDGAFDIRGIALRIDARDEAVPLFREDAAPLFGEFFDVAVGEPARGADGDKTVDGRIGRDLPQDLPSRP